MAKAKRSALERNAKFNTRLTHQRDTTRRPRPKAGHFDPSANVNLEQTPGIAPNEGVIDKTSGIHLQVAQLNLGSELLEPKLAEMKTMLRDPEYWKQAQQHLEELARHGRTGSLEEIEFEEEVNRYFLGHAILRFLGPGEIYGVVETDQDPEMRHNPRELSPAHVEKLTITFVKTGIQDRESPVSIKVDPKFVPQELLALMKAARPQDKSSELPTFDLIRRDPQREAKLEARSLYCTDDEGKLMSKTDMMEVHQELRYLRSQRPLAKLINGNHRINAMINVSKLLKQGANFIISAGRQGEDRDYKQEWEQLNEKVAMATYAVAVFRDDTPDHIIARLAKNDAKRPNLVPRAAETLWTYVDLQNGLVKKMLEEKKAESREEALELIMTSALQKGTAGSGVGNAMVLELVESIGSEQRKGEISPDSIKKLVMFPTTLGMVADTARVFWFYNEHLKDHHVKGMRKDMGGAFVGHAWLSLRLLIRLSSCRHGKQLEDAERFLQRIKSQEKEDPLALTFSAVGTYEAVSFFEHMTSDSTGDTYYLGFYEETQAKAFELILHEEFDRAHIELIGRGFQDPSFIQAVRQVFWRYGISLRGKDEKSRRLSTTVMLYALLPLWEKGCSSSAFFPAAFLPNKSHTQRYLQTTKSLANDDPAIVILESLLDPTIPAWTAGTIATSASLNSSNWSRQQRGTHMLLSRCCITGALGAIDARIQYAMEILESPAFLPALSDIKHCFDAESYRSMRLDCSTFKGSPSARYNIITELVNEDPHFEATFGDASNIHEQLGPARSDLRNAIWERTQVDHVLTQHAVLKLIPDSWWESIQFEKWVQGWADTTKDKAMNSVVALIGWGLFSNQLATDVIARLMKTRTTPRFLLLVVKDLLALSGMEPGWYQVIPEMDVDLGTRETYEDWEYEDISEEVEVVEQAQVQEQGHTNPSELVGVQAFQGGFRATTIAPQGGNVAEVGSMNVKKTKPEAKVKTAGIKQAARPAVPEFKCTKKAKQKDSGQVDRAQLNNSRNERLKLKLPGFPLDSLSQKSQDLEKSSRTRLHSKEQEVSRSVARVAQTLQEIESHRHDLRVSLAYLTGIASEKRTQFPFALDFAVMCLEQGVLAMQNAYITRVAKTLARFHNQTSSWSKAEAMLIGHADGLFNTQLVYLDEATGTITLNLLPTFPCGIQKGVTNHLIQSGQVPRLEVPLITETRRLACDPLSLPPQPSILDHLIANREVTPDNLHSRSPSLDSFALRDTGTKNNITHWSSGNFTSGLERLVGGNNELTVVTEATFHDMWFSHATEGVKIFDKWLANDPGGEPVARLSTEDRRNGGGQGDLESTSPGVTDQSCPPTHALPNHKQPNLRKEGPGKVAVEPRKRKTAPESPGRQTGSAASPTTFESMILQDAIQPSPSYILPGRPEKRRR